MKYLEVAALGTIYTAAALLYTAGWTFWSISDIF